ncbi:endonuclease domain-containing protein [Butyrivibrio sp. VCD2006]|uniref:endonuclease domain-containing protein n=1 Tax=Butyrivibrio sp. VCD2006 TaxID=1280664 RepID=UPI000478724A|nr:endonuclease domain-containing protein [Butyrivibrio sp. VCD2006]
MPQNYNPNLKKYSQSLRKNMTKEERHLWYDFLKTLPLTINRQKSIGPYILDFYCAKTKTGIELDGSQHFESSGIQSDKERDQYFKELGIQILRYSNLDINKNFDAVCEDIARKLGVIK